MIIYHQQSLTYFLIAPGRGSVSILVSGILMTLSVSPFMVFLMTFLTRLWILGTPLCRPCRYLSSI